jgi:mannose-1-phosphate guanylyltransferase
MVPVGTSQKPVLHYVVDTLKHHGYEDITMLGGYKIEQIQNYFRTGIDNGVMINYSIDPIDNDGSVNAIVRAFDKVRHDMDKHYLIYMGDILTNLNLAGLMRSHKRSKSDVTVASDFGYRVRVGVCDTMGNSVIKFIEKPKLNMRVNIGIIMVKRSVMLDYFGFLTDGKDLFTDALPRMVSDKKKIRVYPRKDKSFWWYDVGSVDRYEKLTVEMVDNGMSFLDSKR